jgi:hypothetical protein
MRSVLIRPAMLAIAIAGGIGLSPLHAEAERASTGSLFFAELSASPLFGIDKPIKGCSLDILCGIGLSPFEAGIRAGGAYDAALHTGDLRLDLALGLGRDLRAIIGGLLLFNEPALPDPGGGGARLIARAADWPNRFGIAATIAETPWRPFGAALGIDTELVYTAYRVDAKTALSGAAAFAAGVEARIALRLRWGAGRKE